MTIKLNIENLIINLVMAYAVKYIKIYYLLIFS